MLPSTSLNITNPDMKPNVTRVNTLRYLTSDIGLLIFLGTSGILGRVNIVGHDKSNEEPEEAVRPVNQRCTTSARAAAIQGENRRRLNDMRN